MIYLFSFTFNNDIIFLSSYVIRLDTVRKHLLKIQRSRKISEIVKIMHLFLIFNYIFIVSPIQIIKIIKVI